MEILIVAGMVMKGITWFGYGVTGTYLVKTAFQYTKDYIESVNNEKETH